MAPGGGAVTCNAAKYRDSDKRRLQRSNGVKKQTTRKQKPCVNCGDEFPVDARVGERHRFCRRPECRRASKRLSQARWLSRPENRNYHRGAEQVERNRHWRKGNPGYRSLQRRRQKLQLRLRRVLSQELAAALISCGLQDLNDRQLALVLGLIARACGGGLQDQMAATLRRLMFEGYAILSGPETP